MTFAWRMSFALPLIGRTQDIGEEPPRRSRLNEGGPDASLKFSFGLNCVITIIIGCNFGETRALGRNDTSGRYVLNATVTGEHIRYDHYNLGLHPEGEAPAMGIILSVCGRRFDAPTAIFPN